MNILQDLRTRLSAKLSIADSKAAIAEAKAVLDDPAIAYESNSKARHGWDQAKAGKMPRFGTNAQWKAIVEVAVAEVTGSPSYAASGTAADKPATDPAKPAPNPATAAEKPAKAPAAAKPVPSPRPTAPAAAAPKVPAAAKPSVPSHFASKPSFDHLRGVERASAAMKWKTDREAFFLAEAEKQIAAEEAAARTDPTAGKPVTAASIASEILRQQAEAGKPRPSAWSREAAARRQKVEALAATMQRDAEAAATAK